LTFMSEPSSLSQKSSADSTIASQFDQVQPLVASEFEVEEALV
jgi:hypothetical protein